MGYIHQWFEGRVDARPILPSAQGKYNPCREHKAFIDDILFEQKTLVFNYLNKVYELTDPFSLMQFSALLLRIRLELPKLDLNDISSFLSANHTLYNAHCTTTTAADDVTAKER